MQIEIYKIYIYCHYECSFCVGVASRREASRSRSVSVRRREAKRSSRKGLGLLHFVLIRIKIPLHLIEQKYLCIFAKSLEARNHISGKTITTAGQKTVNQSGLSSLPVWLPPLAEQKRIVEKCDRLMSLCDTLEAKLKQGRDNSEKLMEVAAKHVLTA